MITFVGDNNQFISTVQRIDKYLIEHVDSDLFAYITITADIKNKTITAVYPHTLDVDNTLIFTERDLEKPLTVALKLIGFAAIMESFGDIEPDYFECLYTDECD